MLAALSAPVAIAYGTSSPAVSELIAKRLAATVKHGEAVPLDGADHGMLATHAPQLAELIRSTVARAVLVADPRRWDVERRTPTLTSE
jgi:pimeloyl-ACP methyl ester carboxylesterase